MTAVRFPADGAAARRLVAVGWAALASLLGLLLATQPLPVALSLIVLAASAVLALITPLAALVALLILAPLRTLIATESAVQLPLDIGQLALLAFVAFLMLERLKRRVPILPPHGTPLYIPLLGFVAAGALSAFGAVSLGAWLNEWLKWLEILVLVAAVLALGQAGRWRWIVFGLTVAALANAVIGIYEYFGGSGADHLIINLRYFRAFGTFGQPNPFGGFMGLVAPLALMTCAAYAVEAWRALRERQSAAAPLAAMLFYAAASALIVAGVYLSWSRGAWLAFGASMVVILFALPRRLWQSLVLLAVVGTAVGALWLSGRLPASIVDRVSSATQELFAFDDVRGVDISPENYAVVERLAHWQAALNMIRARPLLGVGLGNYEVAYENYRLINWKFPLGHAHNSYLNVFAEAGMIGLISYAALWLSVVYFTWRARRHPSNFARMTVLGLLGTWTYLTVHSLTDNLYVNNLFLHIGVMLGILALLHKEARETKRLRT